MLNLPFMGRKTSEIAHTHNWKIAPLYITMWIIIKSEKRILLSHSIRDAYQAGDSIQAKYRVRFWREFSLYLHSKVITLMGMGLVGQRSEQFGQILSRNQHYGWTELSKTVMC